LAASAATIAVVVIETALRVGSSVEPAVLTAAVVTVKERWPLSCCDLARRSDLRLLRQRLVRAQLVRIRRRLAAGIQAAVASALSALDERLVGRLTFLWSVGQCVASLQAHKNEGCKQAQDSQW
jgi:hypothetical protein